MTTLCIPPRDPQAAWSALSGALADPPAGRARAQELLDVLAVAGGLKPVALLGPAIGDAGSMAAVAGRAGDLGLALADGCPWVVGSDLEGLPEWYSEAVAGARKRASIHYVCGGEEIADRVRAACSAASITARREARMLGYPACCVDAHHARSRCYHAASAAMIERRAGDDAAKMRRLAAAGTLLEPATAVERETLAKAFAFTPCPFTSINMCAPCGSRKTGPARDLSSRYRELALAVGGDLARLLATCGD